MEPTNQGVPADPSSSLQQPQPPYPPPSPLWPHQRAIQRPQPQQQNPPPLAPPPPPPQPQYPPPMSLLPPQHAVQRPQLPSFALPPPPLQPYLPMRRPQCSGGYIPGSSNASRFVDHASVVAPRRGTWGDSFRMFDPSAEQSSSTRSFSAGRSQTSAGATVPFSAQGDNATFDPYASALPSADQVDPRSWIPRLLTLEEVRDFLLVNQLVPQVVGLAVSPEFVVQLLKEGSDAVRGNVFNGVLGALRFVMEDSEWSGVFIELLREGRLPELRAILHVVRNDKVFLLKVANAGCGMTVLVSLVEAVNLHPQLRRRLIDRLLYEGLFHHRRSQDLLRSIFSTFPYEDSSIVIQRAIDTFRGVLATMSGSLSMAECFVFAKNDERRDLKEIILGHTVEIAKGKFSNFFLQRVLECGSYPLKSSITHCVLDNLVSLSMDRYGVFVVRACFVQTGSARLPLLQRVLTEFQCLPDRQFARLVEDPCANHVVSRLLMEGRRVRRGQFSIPIRDATTDLAWRIEMLQAAGVAPDWRVMDAVSKVLS
ncbi:unnamed protein product [Urochloa humidicola]